MPLFAEVIALDLWPVVGLLFAALVLFAVIHVGGITLGVWLFGRRVTSVVGQLTPVAERLDDRLDRLTESLSDLGGDVRVMATRIEAIERLTERSERSPK